MSYCRWSSDYYRCDVYCYESDRGFETHVAGRRVNVDPPAELVAMEYGRVGLWAQWVRASDRWYDSLKNADGDIPDELWLDLNTIGDEANESYIDATAAECAERLRGLRDKGFNVPDYAIEELESEALEGKDAGLFVIDKRTPRPEEAPSTPPRYLGCSVPCCCTGACLARDDDDGEPPQ